MNKPLKVLIVEDSEDDALLVIRELRHGGYEPDFEIVETAEAMRSALGNRTWDLVISDYSLPAFNAFAALNLVIESGLDLPFIIVSGTIGEETAVAAMRAGANDYLMKGNLARLSVAIERELREAGLRREHGKTEEALRTAEATYRNMFLNSQIGLFRTDMKTGMILDANGAVARFIGYKDRSELMAEPFNIVERYVDPKEREKMISLLQAHGEFRNYETRFKRNDGSIIWMRYSAKMVPEKGWIEGVSEDISDQKLAEISLRQSEEKFSKLFFSSPTWMAITRLEDGTYLEVNKAFEEITGFNRSEVIGRTSLELGLWPEPDGERERYMALVREGGGFREQQVTFLARDGEPIAALWSAYMMDLGGETCLLSTVMDISELERSRVERKDLYAQLLQARKMESIGRLAGGIAHDFNNLLFPIIGRSELLLDDLPRHSQEYENVQEILKAGMRGSDLVKQILAFSRQSEHKLIPVRPRQVLKEVIKLIRSTIPSYIEIEENLQSDCGFIMADPTEIHQVAMNIITNAFHAVEAKGGKITVLLKEVALEADAWSEDVPGPGRYALFSITDTGHGMPPDLMDKIFEPYFTTKEQGKGTGLGLAVAYGIIRKLKGDIKVYSEVGKGTAFNIYLPLMEKPSDIYKVKKTEADPGGNERILLVDDEETVVNLEKLMLERLGYHVSERTSSSDALKAFRANPYAFDLVISDMTMPNITGDQLSKELISVRPDIPVILCTGFSTRIDQEKAEAIGVKGFLMKPVVRSEMAKMVRKVLDKAKDGA